MPLPDVTCGRCSGSFPDIAFQQRPMAPYIGTTDRRHSVCSGDLREGVVTHECRGPVGSLKARCNRARRGGHKRW